MSESGLGKLASRLGAMLSERSSVEKVADDPALMAELLLLVRMSFADGSVNSPEAATLKAIITRELGLSADDAGEVLRFIDDFGYETTTDQAADMLTGLPDVRKRAIMAHLAEMARADGSVTEAEKTLFHATARRLGLE
jgi:uncharacterized tellurite resistance protein B-like protein